jgi:hypothetical protein
LIRISVTVLLMVKSNYVQFLNAPVMMEFICIRINIP